MESSSERREELEMDTANQIFSNSPNMLALCLTVIGLIKIYATLQRMTTLVDNFLVFAVFAFFLATVSSYFALRAKTRKNRLKLGRVADISFLGGLGCAAAVAGVATFSLVG
jgi:hypothetical protein